MHEKITACGAAPVINDLLATAACNRLWRQMLALLCCNCEGEGAALYFTASIVAGDTGSTNTYAFGPVPQGGPQFGAAAFDNLNPAIPNPFTISAGMIISAPAGLTAAFNIPAAALTANGGWIDSIALVQVGATWEIQIATSNAGNPQPTVVPFTLSNGQVGVLLVQVEPPVPLLEYSVDGIEWTEVEDEEALNVENLSGLQFRLRITSLVDQSVTVTSTVPQVQAVVGGPVFALTAGVPQVILFTARDPGVTTIGLAFSVDPAMSFNVMSYVLDGIIRVVNSDPTPPVALIVALAQISAANVTAAVVYATPELARAAASDGDWIVGTEGAEFAAPNAITASLRICSDDSVAPVLGRYGDGFRMTGLVTLSATGKNIFIHDIGLDSNSSQVVQVTGDSTNIIERCRIRKRGAVFDAVAKISAGTLLLANNYVQVAAGNNGLAHSTGGADGSVTCINNTVIATEAGVANGFFGDDPTRRPLCGGNYSGLANGATWTGNAYNANTQAQGAGFNGGNDTSAPGATAYDNVAANTFIADDTPATLNMAPINRATLATYPAANNAALSCRDVDKATRSDWFMGAKWIPA